MANQPYPPSYQSPLGDPCPTCGQAMAVSWKSVFNGREFVPVTPPPQWVYSCSWCADPRTAHLRARIADLSARLNATETVVALVRSRNCCDGEDAAHTHAMIHALCVLDDVAGDVSKCGSMDE